MNPLRRLLGRPAPKVETEPNVERPSVDDVAAFARIFEQMGSRAFGGPVGPATFYIKRLSWGTGDGTMVEQPALRDAVSDQLAAIHDAAPQDWQGHEEVPAVPPELTDTYQVAFASAAKNCEHRNSVETLYARRERFCTDCHKFFTRRSPWD